jgi:hypothetical protein
MSLRLILAVALAATALAGCGGPGGSGYGCQGNSCTATFDGTGSQDLSSELGGDANVEVRDINGDTVSVEAAGQEHNLKVGDTQSFGPLEITLESADGDSASLRVVRKS